VEGTKRIDTVTVALSSGVMKLPWESRQALLLYLRRFEDARSIVEAFADAGTSQPVRLPPDRKATLLVLVEAWLDELGSSADDLAGVWELRNVLHDDLDERGARPTS
jgi:hypothetical protein